jgi:AraC-like DNA-binding protein
MIKQLIEKELTLPNVSLLLATAQWDTAESSVQFTGYNICQRLSDSHSALRIGNLAVCEAFPRVRSVAFLPPSLSVRLFPVAHPFRALNCIFGKDYFEEATGIGERQWDEHTGALVSIKNARIETMMQEIYGELGQPGFAHDLMIEAASTMILVEMARYAQRFVKTIEGSGANQGLAAWQLRRIQERLDASLEMGYPSMRELAQICGISESHLMRTFKASTGWPIHRYVAEERLNAAKEMLAKDQLNSMEISALVGFRSPAYFATAFKKMTGKSPTEYRKEVRAMAVGYTGRA